MKKFSFKPFVFFSFLLLFMIVQSAQAQFDPELFSEMKARSIGPAGMSGRIAAIDAVVSDPNIIYVGAATGGVWKSTNAGLTWEPIFDDQPISSIGSIAIFQKNPSIVWVGTGEGNPRNSAGVGNGIFKSLDGGASWKFLGLEKTERIHRIVLHPWNENIAYAAAMGTTWGENPERGVYKTTNGGKSWKKILFVNDKTGCAELVIDPSNPNKLFAAMWEHRRWPWFFNSGGAGSGLYVTYDGGEHWKKLTEKDGLPKGKLGRIGIAIAKNNPDIVYALVEAKKSALCRSDDGGRHWRIVNQERNVNSRPFYYADIRVDPQNENRIFSLQSSLLISEDGGKSFHRIRSRVHSDNHALWIHPGNSKFMMDGNDGGVAISYDRGKTWRFVENLPLAQFYHINYDMEIPYNIYGGMQDNGSWRGPSQVWENMGIRNFHWHEVGFGDGFATISDPMDPNSGYAMSQGGYLIRFNVITGERKDIRPPAPDSIKLRFNWNAGIALDPFDPQTVYFGSQFLHKSTDRGDSWTIISPDLTTNDPEKQKQNQSGGLTFDVTNAENFCSIITIAPSPVQRGVIWVGTDDGQVHVTQDGGKTWTNVTKNIPKLPPTTWCPHIEASKFEAGTAYAVFDDHRRSNWTTYIYKTKNFGKKWKSLTKNNPVAAAKPPEQWGFAHVIEQDPVNKNLLYLGTEFGLFISFDDGVHWMKWKHGVPTAPVRALAVHPRDLDLIIGTHGRAAYVLDDVRPLETFTEKIQKKQLHLFEIPKTYQHEIKAMPGYHFPADAYFAGENRRYGAMITFYVNQELVKKVEAKKSKKKTDAGNQQKQKTVDSDQRRSGQYKDGVVIEIYDQDNTLVRKFETSLKKGINRTFWNLRSDGFKMPSFGQRQRRYTPPGPEVIPGTYKVAVKVGDEKASSIVEVLLDPRVKIDLAARKEKYDLIRKIGKTSEVIAAALNNINATEKSLKVIQEAIAGKEDKTLQSLGKECRDLQKKLKKIKGLFTSVNKKQGIVREDNVFRKLRSVQGSLSSSFDKPTPSQLKRLEQAKNALQQALLKYNSFFEKSILPFENKVLKGRLKLFPEFKPLSIKAGN
ncbi:hypothetical protein B6D60_05885 [candidate division KSB1 bacterium 4484_87]|nr:MAG: hypothetical protein B6D60_05885 [candidate division KSB1 bacterium 4484_87]